MAERETGTIKWFDGSKGYGFIKRDQGGDVFLHFSALHEGDRHALQENQRVEFEVEAGEKGPRAANVVVLT